MIELLVVIVVISVLTAILIPSVSAVRRKADEVTCTGNLRQLAMGVQLYAQSNNNTLPLSMQADPQNPQSGSTVSWQILIQRQLNIPFPKVGEKSLFICPAHRETYSAPAYRTYGLNLIGDSPTANPPKLLTLSAPARTTLLVETKYETSGAGYNALSGNINGVGGQQRLDARHREKTNTAMAMADGSVRLLAADDSEVEDFLLNIRK